MASNTSVPAAQNTPLTLPNVIHFLQNESSRYERDRNFWELERAEMKARIAKLEGERKSNERMKDWYLRRLRMLEVALHEERLQSDPNAKPLPSVVDDEHAEKKSRSTRNSRIEHDDAYLELIQSSQAGLRAQAGRNKSRAYLEKCLTEVTYLVNAHPSITANKPASPQSFENINDAPLNHILGPRPMRDQAPQNIDGPQRQASPAPMANNYFDEPDTGTNAIHQVPGRRVVDEVEASADSTSNDEPVVKIQHTFDAQGNFVESMDSSALGPSGSIVVESDNGVNASGAMEDPGWDFGDENPPECDREMTSRLRRVASPRTIPRKAGIIEILRKNNHVWLAVAVGSVIHLYQDEETDPVLKLTGHEGSIDDLLLDSSQSDNLMTLYSAGEDMVIRRWDLDLTSLNQYSESTSPSVTFISHSRSINALALVDGALISCSADASIRRWDTRSGDSRRVWRISGPANEVFPTSLCNLSDDRFAAGYSDGSVKIYSINNDKSTMSLFDGRLTTGRTTSVADLASVSFMNQTFLCVNLDDDGLRFYNTRSGELVREIPITEPGGSPRCLCAVPAESQFVTGFSDGRVRTYSYRGDRVQEVNVGEDGGDIAIVHLASSQVTGSSSPADVFIGDSSGRVHRYCIVKE
ncbi:WD domain protein [Taphrina deformans PYCC 5710]|uniref:WD domain protein n=1 Tax=Taphrina deformans (strain PYCC 5710 / ATCC 11124 / CBS 356.35 / IMI 108563 / JCM 9778 / NBRC 8474) TaxID=1097556 RepID=R4X8V0_TAPDE|nr:WD domain protein [Taphrina deformans PYCC 5710]|eukprot:CCG80552.1 WD domain protein [Taphrina deformans PYCC 5710]